MEQLNFCTIFFKLREDDKCKKKLKKKIRKTIELKAAASALV